MFFISNFKGNTIKIQFWNDSVNLLMKGFQFISPEEVRNTGRMLDPRVVMFFFFFFLIYVFLFLFFFYFILFLNFT